jgi:hypothetical protein
VAASLHGKPRVTKDVAIVAIVEDDEWGALVKAGEAWGIHLRMHDALDFARTTRVLLLVHEPSSIEVDLSFGMLPFERELVDRAQARVVSHVRFPLACAEDIIVMKALALRPRDIADKSIVELTAHLDLHRVRTTVAQLSQALESEDHATRLEEILRGRR